MSNPSKLQLADLHDLCDRYVPIASRHPTLQKVLPGQDSWWPVHELGHLLTVPTSWIGEPLYGMELSVGVDHPHARTWWAYELAATSVSRGLLLACGRGDLFYGPAGEYNATPMGVLENASRALAREILSQRGVLRLPSTRDDLEEKLRRATAG